MIATDCPSADHLRDLAHGRLDDERSEELFDHVRGCDVCKSELETIPDAEDSLIASLRCPDPGVDFDAEPDCKLAVAKALGALADRGEGAADDLAALLPQRIGEYEVVRPLGRGGMGRVFLARHTKLGRKVALKILAGHRLADPRMRERFAAEMRAVGKLSHPNIVTAYDAREVDGTAVLVTEYIDGLDLGELVAGTGPLPIADACEIGRQVAAALAYTGQQGFVHRDVKPSNITITITKPDGSKLTMTVPDQSDIDIRQDDRTFPSRDGQRGSDDIAASRESVAGGTRVEEVSNDSAEPGNVDDPLDQRQGYWGVHQRWSDREVLDQGVQLVVIKDDQMYLLEDDKIVAAGTIEIEKFDDLSPAFIFHDAVNGLKVRGRFRKPDPFGSDAFGDPFGPDPPKGSSQVVSLTELLNMDQLPADLLRDLPFVVPQTLSLNRLAGSVAAKVEATLREQQESLGLQRPTGRLTRWTPSTRKNGSSD